MKPISSDVPVSRARRGALNKEICATVTTEVVFRLLSSRSNVERMSDAS